MQLGVVLIALLLAPPPTAKCVTIMASATMVLLVPGHVIVSVGTPVRLVPMSALEVYLTPAVVMEPVGPMVHASAMPTQPLATGPQTTALFATLGIMVSCATAHVPKWAASCVQDMESAVWN